MDGADRDPERAGPEDRRRRRERTKRAFDLAIVLLSAPLTIPVLLVVAVLVRVKLGTPVLFRQVRPGRDGRPFPPRRSAR
ncbi:MAG: sugar transferase [Hyphomicrobiaceae bacterium]